MWQNVDIKLRDFVVFKRMLLHTFYTTQEMFIQSFTALFFCTELAQSRS